MERENGENIEDEEREWREYREKRERMERMDRIERLERLERIEGIERIERTERIEREVSVERVIVGTGAMPKIWRYDVDIGVIADMRSKVGSHDIIFWK